MVGEESLFFLECFSGTSNGILNSTRLNNMKYYCLIHLMTVVFSNSLTFHVLALNSFHQSQKLDQKELLSRKIKVWSHSPASVKRDKLLSNHIMRKSKFIDATFLTFPPNLGDVFSLDIYLKVSNKHKWY